MQDLLKQLASAVPSYFDSLLKLVSGPAPFIADKANRRELNVKKALGFLAVSYLLGQVLLLPMHAGDELYKIAASGVFTLLNWALVGCAIFGAFRLVGGRALLPQIMSIAFYYGGIVELLLAITFIAGMGSLRVIDPPTYATASERAHAGNSQPFLFPTDSPMAAVGLAVLVAVTFTGFAVIVAWWIFGWRAFREQSGVSWQRSLGAGGIFALLCVPIIVLFFVIAVALINPITKPRETGEFNKAAMSGGYT